MRMWKNAFGPPSRPQGGVYTWPKLKIPFFLGVPHFGALFGHFGHFGQNHGTLLEVHGSQTCYQNRAHTLGGDRRCSLDARFDRPGTVDTKYSLYMTSVFTPKGVCTVLVAGLTSAGCHSRIVISAKIPKMAKKHLKWGTP